MYDLARPHIQKLEQMGHKITPPNCYDDPGCGARMKAELSPEKYSEWKASMLHKQVEKVKNSDAVLVMNFEKDAKANYIGGATFLELYKAWELGKKLFLYNPIPEGMLHDEIIGMNPVVINGDLTKII